MLKIYAAGAVLGLAALVGGSAWWVHFARDDGAFAACNTGQVGGGQIGGSFELIDQTGKLVTDKTIFEKPALVYFGYTFCPDVCPLDNVRNADAVDILMKKGYDVTPVFITVDPKRDRPEIMASYVENIHPKMIGLTGSSAQVRVAAQAYKVPYREYDDQTDPYYTVDHTTFTYLMMPKTGFADFFRRDLSAEELADRVSCFVGKAQS